MRIFIVSLLLLALAGSFVLATSDGSSKGPATPAPIIETDDEFDDDFSDSGSDDHYDDHDDDPGYDDDDHGDHGHGDDDDHDDDDDEEEDCSGSCYLTYRRCRRLGGSSYRCLFAKKACERICEQKCRLDCKRSYLICARKARLLWGTKEIWALKRCDKTYRLCSKKCGYTYY